MQLRPFLLTLPALVLLCSCTRSPFFRSAQVERKYVHTYGVELTEKEWKEYGMHGQVISKDQQGITVTENYDHNVLHGAKTWTFPNSKSIERSLLFDKGSVKKEIRYELSGLPVHEIEYVSDSETVERSFSKFGFPYAVEVFIDGRLFDAQYYDTKGALYTAVIDYHGERTARNFDGVITKKDDIVDGRIECSTEYYPEGTPKSITPFVDGRVHGEKKTFLASSVPLAKEPYVNGRLEGVATYYENGVKAREVTYLGGLKHGPEYVFNSKGAIIKEINWRRDQLHGPRIDYQKPGTPKEWFWEGSSVTEFTFDQRSTGAS
jgi:antitoxin component YwqK of YwqJK toxin-antitoxin module